MGDNRIDGSAPKNPYPECDEETGICGEVKKPEPEVSKPDPLVSNIDESWHPPMSAESKPSHLAQIAKNMSTSKPPADAASSRPEAYAGRTKDAFGVEVGFALSRGDGEAVGQAGVEVSTKHVGPKVSAFHEEHRFAIGDGELSVSADAGVAHYGMGVKNSDGSTGIHIGGAATVAGAEATLRKEGAGSVTVGGGRGIAAEVSVGVKKDGNTHDICARLDTPVVTVGMCIPVWTRAN
jgi:hypothetical protein